MDEEKAQRNAEDFLGSKILLSCYGEADRSIRHLERQDLQKLKLPEILANTALKRWRQIKLLLREAVQNGLSEPSRSATLGSFDAAETTANSTTTFKVNRHAH